MKYLSIFSLLGLFVLSGCDNQSSISPNSISNNSEGKILFEQKCSMCHIGDRPSSEAQKDALIAPAINGVMKHMRMEFGNNTVATKAFMKDYIMNPSKEKALCQTEKIAKFGLMPSQKGLVSEAELDKIVNYLISK